MSDLELALPLPPAAAVVEAAAGRLVLLGVRCGDTMLADEARRGAALARSWSGPAAEAARAEAAAAGALLTVVGEATAEASAALTGYAAALTEGHRRVLALREEWYAGARSHRLARDVAVSVGADPAGAALAAARVEATDRAWAALRARLRDRHTGILAQADAAGRRAAALVRLAVDRLPGGGGGELRAAVLDRLPLTAGAAARAEADRLVAALLDATGRPPQEWGAPEAAALAGMRARLGDPLVARALCGALPPDALARLVGRLVAAAELRAGRGATDPEVEGALLALATALVSAADPRRDQTLDAASRAAAASWRREWLRALARSGSTLVDDGCPDPPFTGFLALALLLDRADRSDPQLRPGAQFAATVGVALVEADRLSPGLPPQGGGWPAPRTLVAGLDPVEVLLRVVRGDPDAQRALLLGRLGDGELVVAYAAGARLGRAGDRPAALATPALAAVLAEATATRDAQAAVIAGAALDGYGRAAEGLRARAGDPGAVLALDRALAGLRATMADQLAAYPEAVWAAIRSGPGTDGWAPPDAARAAGPDPTPAPWVAWDGAAWTIALRDRERLAAVLAEIGKDRLAPGAAGADTHSPPALDRLLQTLVAAESRALAGALAAGTPAAVEAGVVRLGQVVGFTLTVVGAGIARVEAAADSIAQLRHTALDAVLDRVELPAATRRLLPAAVADGVLRALRAGVRAAARAAWPVDGAATAATRAAHDRDRAEDALLALGHDLVSAAGDWPADQDPVAWGRVPGRVGFCGPDGRPLPVAAMTPAQHTSFRIWSAAIPAYTTVPARLVDQVAAGAAAGLRATGPAGSGG